MGEGPWLLVTIPDVCSPGQLSLEFSPMPCSRSCAQSDSITGAPPLFLSVAFNSPGPKLQVVHDDPRLAPGHPELHEDTTVSFQPGAEHPRQGMGMVIASLVARLPPAGLPKLW